MEPVQNDAKLNQANLDQDKNNEISANKRLTTVSAAREQTTLFTLVIAARRPVFGPFDPVSPPFPR